MMETQLIVQVPVEVLFALEKEIGKQVLRYFPWLGYEGRPSLPATKYSMVTK